MGHCAILRVRWCPHIHGNIFSGGPRIHTAVKQRCVASRSGARQRWPPEREPHRRRNVRARPPVTPLWMPADAAARPLARIADDYLFKGEAAVTASGSPANILLAP
eukprot:1528214-Prymnesium_polylepis.1